MKVYQVRYNNGESFEDNCDYGVATFSSKEEAEKLLKAENKILEATKKEHDEFYSLDERCRPEYPPEHLQFFNPFCRYYIHEIEVLDKYVDTLIP